MRAPHRYVPVFALTVLVACGGAAPLLPAPSRDAAVAALEAAHRSGARDTPAGLYQLALANQELQLADELIDAGDMVQAALLLRKVEDDADRAAGIAPTSSSTDAGAAR